MPAKRKQPVKTETDVDTEVLEPKQLLFVEEYLQRMNATQAAIAAGYSKRTARQQGSRLLTNVDIQARIRARLDEAAADANEVLQRLTSHMRGTTSDFYHIDKNGKPVLDFRKAKKLGSLHLVHSISFETETRSFGQGAAATTIVNEKVSFEIYNAQAAAQMLGKHHRLFDRAGEDDWRGELIRAGLDPDEALETLAENFFAHIQPGAGSADSGSLGEGESASRSGA